MSSTGLVINNRSTGGQVYKLKENISIDQAHQKGLKDGLDQVYFSSGKDKFVLQGDNLKLGEVNEVLKGNVPTALVKLDGKPAEIKIEKIDDEVSTVKDGFVKNGKIGAYSTNAVAIGVPVAALSGFSAIIAMKAGSATAKAITTGGVYVGMGLAVAGAAGLAYYAGKSIVQGAANKPNEQATSDLKGAKINTDNNAKPAGLVSVEHKKEVATKIAVDLIVDSAIDILLK